jgi:hypothetical protein
MIIAWLRQIERHRCYESHSSGKTRRIGANVIGTVSTEVKARARTSGADYLIVYTEQDFAAENQADHGWAERRFDY